MNATQIANEIKGFNTVPNNEVAMHVNAILAGDYTLADLRQNAPSFYAYNGYEHEDELMNQM